MSARPTLTKTIGVPACAARIRRTAAVLSGALVATMALTGGVAAASGPTYMAGNPDCSDIQGSASWTELKIDPPRGGANRISDSYLTAVATVSGTVFDFTTNQGVDAVIVKGGPNANVYRYGSEATSGDDLHAPTNPSNGQFYGLSHITFCYDRGTPPAPSDPCKTNPNGMDADGKPCTPPSDPCKTNPNGMDADGKPCTPPSDPCKTNPNGMDANGEPCTPATDPCKTNPNGMDANGEPCTPATDPCKTNPNGMDANGRPCTPAPPVVTPPVAGDPVPTDPVLTLSVPTEPVPTVPVLTRTPSLAPPAMGGSLGRVGQVVPAGASIVRLSRCVARPFSAIVRGRGIRRVTFFVNGRRVRTMTGGRTRYALRVSHRQARGGVLRIRARVDFVAGSGKRPRTLRMTALRCAVLAQAPRFTG